MTCRGLLLPHPPHAASAATAPAASRAASWCHGGADFEVWDDVSPFGKPGGLAMRGKVRNWARLVNGKPKFDRKAVPNPDFTSAERSVVAEAAGRVTDTPQRVPSSGDQARTVPISRMEDPEYRHEKEEAPAPVSTAHTPEAA